MSELLTLLQDAGMVSAAQPQQQATGSFVSPNTQAPMTLGAQNMQLDPKQQFRIQQAMSDMNRINAAKGKTQFGQATNQINSDYTKGLSAVNTASAVSNLGQGMGFQNQMTQLNADSQSQNMSTLMQILGPMLGGVMNAGGF